MLQEAAQCGQVKMPWMWETGPDHHSFMFKCAYISSKLIKVVLEWSSTSKKKKQLKSNKPDLTHLCSFPVVCDLGDWEFSNG